jgi:phospholipid N-methyltransferase
MWTRTGAPGACLRADHGHPVRVHQTCVERFEPGCRYDAIVSSLPFTNFAADDVDAIMERYLCWLRPGGVLTYFAYRGTRRARSLVASRAESDRHRAVEQVLADYQIRYGAGRATVWANLPPATVWQLQSERPLAAVAHPNMSNGGAP